MKRLRHALIVVAAVALLTGGAGPYEPVLHDGEAPQIGHARVYES
jgi:hypothetical protein